MRTGPIVCGKGLVTKISAVLHGVPTALIFSMRSFIRLNGCGERLVTEISEVLYGVLTALIFSRDLLLDWLGFHVNVSCELRKEEKWLMCKSNKWNQFTCLSCSRMLNDKCCRRHFWWARTNVWFMAGSILYSRTYNCRFLWLLTGKHIEKGYKK